ncbi:MAG: RNA polymerase sporulation sigma factor SigH [Clostridiales bacterium]|nr:RNA polymerase sporulation sigma factor SigH [Clostridiales bacterium]
MFRKYDGVSDEELVIKAQQGDHTAEEALISRYKDLVKSRAHLYFIAGADNEDVMQEGMIGLFKAVKGYEEGKNASFRTFASLCVNRQIISAIKTASRNKHFPLNSSVSLDIPAGDKEDSEKMENILASSEGSPEELMLVRDMIEQIIINTPQFLSSFEQKVWSAYLSGKNYNVIAEDLGKTPKSIDNAIQRIKKKVEKYVLE